MLLGCFRVNTGILSKEAQEEAYKRGLEVLPEVLALKEFASRKPAIQETKDISRQQFLSARLLQTGNPAYRTE
jgi:hypothetical protein